MDRRALLTVALALLALSAGCSVLIGDDGSTATPPSAQEPTPTEGATATPPADRSYPDGYGPDGVADPDVAAENHVETLTGVDSYRFRFDVGVSGGDGTDDAFVYLASVDRRNETALEVRDDGDVTRYQYYEDDRLYLRLVVGEEETYNATDEPFAPERLTGDQFLRPLLGNVEYGGAERVESDDCTGYRYTRERVTDPAAIIPTNATEDDVESFNVELIVHDEGYVCGARYAVVTTDGSGLEAVSVVKNVGAETVTRPDWYDEAAEG